MNNNVFEQMGFGKKPAKKVTPAPVQERWFPTTQEGTKQIFGVSESKKPLKEDEDLQKNIDRAHELTTQIEDCKGDDSEEGKKKCAELQKELDDLLKKPTLS